MNSSYEVRIESYLLRIANALEEHNRLISMPVVVPPSIDPLPVGLPEDFSECGCGADYLKACAHCSEGRLEWREHQLRYEA